MADTFPYDTAIETIIVSRKATLSKEVSRVDTCVLKPGPRTWRIAFLLEIRDPAQNAFHHHELLIETHKRKKASGWTHDEKRTVRLGEKDEVSKLVTFIRSVLDDRLPSDSGEYDVLPHASFKKVETLLRAMERGAKREVLVALLSDLEREGTSLAELASVFEKTGSAMVREAAAAAKLRDYRAALDSLTAMVENEQTTEPELQAFLEKNLWVFGTDYSELLDRRRWTRDDMQDLMVRRTADSYLEIIELKRPFGADLFRKDPSRDVLFPSASLSQALGQVQGYIEEVDRVRDSVKAKDDEDPLKVRARIVIGRDGDDDQKRALRNFNGHLHRIEVLTFDQLLRIAQRVLDLFSSQRTTDEPTGFEGGDDDIPF